MDWENCRATNEIVIHPGYGSCKYFALINPKTNRPFHYSASVQVRIKNVSVSLGTKTDFQMSA